MVKTIPLESGDVIVVNWNVTGHLAGWIEALYALSKTLKDCGILTALVLDTQEKIYVHGSFISPRLHVPVSYGMGQSFYNQYPGTRAVSVSHFVCAIVKKALIAKLPLTEHIGENPFVDADYCLEAAKLGFKTYATSDLIVQYGGQAHTGVTAEEYEKSFTEAYEVFNKKWGPSYDRALKTPLLYHTSVAQPSGFAMAARGYIRALTDNGVRVSYNFLRGTNAEEGESEDEIINSICEDHGDLKMPQVVWAQAPFFNKNSGAYKIGHCEYEGETPPEEWVDQCNEMDELWVPSNWDREKFRKAGVSVPIYVIAQGIDPAYFHPDMAPMRIEVPETTRFITNAAWDPRKNLPNLIKAFQAEFTAQEDVCLVIKTINLGLVGSIKDELKKLKNVKTAARVYIKEEPLPQEQLGCFYTAGDCLVYPTHGEAWGLPLFEALACGIPIITTDWGAPAEYLRDAKGKAFPGVHFLRQQKTTTDTPYVYLQGNHWAEPSIPHLMERMRYVYTHKKEERAAARKTSELIRRTFDWHEVVKPIQERVKAIYKESL